jgi:hypothetical protein
LADAIKKTHHRSRLLGCLPFFTTETVTAENDSTLTQLSGSVTDVMFLLPPSFYLWNSAASPFCLDSHWLLQAKALVKGKRVHAIDSFCEFGKCVIVMSSFPVNLNTTERNSGSEACGKAGLQDTMDIDRQVSRTYSSEQSDRLVGDDNASGIVRFLESLSSINASAKQPGDTSASRNIEPAQNSAGPKEFLALLAGLAPVMSSRSLYEPPGSQVESAVEARPFDPRRRPPATAGPAEREVYKLVEKLDDKSTARDYKNAVRGLDAYIRSDKIGSSVELARQYRDWAEVMVELRFLHDCGKYVGGRHYPVSDAVEALIKMEERNPYARIALLSLLLGRSNDPAVQAWKREYGAVDGKHIFVPNVSESEGGDDLTIARIKILKHLADSKLRPTGAEAAALTIQLSAGKNLTDNAEDVLRARLVLEELTPQNGDARNATMQGILFVAEQCKGNANFSFDRLLKILMPNLTPSSYEDFLRLAKQGNPLGLRVVAAAASGNFDDRFPQTQPPVSEKAKQALIDIAERDPELRKSVVMAVHSDERRRFMAPPLERQNTQKSLVPLLAAYSSQLDPVKDAALIANCKELFNWRLRADDADAVSVRSEIAHLFTKDEALHLMEHTFERNFGKFSAIAIRMSPDVQRVVIEKVKASLDSGSHEEKVKALWKLSQLAPCLSKEDVLALDKFSGAPAPTVDSKKRLEFFQLQAAAAGALIKVLENGTNASAPLYSETGARETAFALLKERTWRTSPAFVGANAPDLESLRQYNRFGPDPSTWSGQQLATSVEFGRALRKYYDERPFESSKLIDVINTISEHAKIVPPIRVLLNKAGVGELGNADDKEVIDKAQAIASNYSENDVRRVTANVSMVNSLPPSERARLMGWTSLPKNEREELGWLEPDEPTKQKIGWDRLGPDMREKWCWSQAAQIDLIQVYSQMQSNNLGQHHNKNLLIDLDKQLSVMIKAAQIKGERAEKELGRVMQSRAEEHDILCKRLKDGAMLGSKVVFAVSNGGRDPDLQADSKVLLNNLEAKDRVAKDMRAEWLKAGAEQQQLQLAQDIYQYRTLVNKGDRYGADFTAIGLYRKYGDFSGMAPEVWAELPSILQRQRPRGGCNIDKLPIYGSLNKEPRQQALEIFKQGLGLIPPLNAEKPSGLHQLGDNSMHARSVVESDPVLRKFTHYGALAQTLLFDLQKLFLAAANGDKYEEVVHALQKKGQQLNYLFATTSGQELDDLAERIKLMEQIGLDPERVKALKQTHNLLNSFGPTLFPNENGEYKNNNQPVREFITDLTALTPNNLESSITKHAITFAATAGATALALAVLPTFGVSSPAALSAWSALAGLVARDWALEKQFELNQGGYTTYGVYKDQGSLGARTWDKLAGSDLNMLEKFGVVLAENGGTYSLQAATDWAAFLASAGMARFLCNGRQAGEAFKSLIKCPPPNAYQLRVMLSRAELVAGDASAAGRFMSSVLHDFGKHAFNNVAIAGLQTALDEGAQALMGIDQEAAAHMSKEAHFVLSLSTSTAIALGQGIIHGGRGHNPILKTARLNEGVLQFTPGPGYENGHFLAHLKKHGFHCEPVSPGVWEVSNISRGPQSKKFYIQSTVDGNVNAIPKQQDHPKIDLAHARRLQERMDKLPKDSDEYHQLQLSKSISEGRFAPGTYRLKFPGQGSSVELSVGLTTVSLDGKPTLVKSGAPVSVTHVAEIIEAIEVAGIKPDRVSILQQNDSTQGSLRANNNLYEIYINTANQSQPLRLVYNHETGHLYDHASWRLTATPELKQRLDEAYNHGLSVPSGPADLIARRLGFEPTDAWRARFKTEMLAADKSDFLAGDLITTEQKLKYLVCKGELYAEMFKLYQEQLRIAGELGRTPSYQELLERCTKSNDPVRAKMMQGFEKLYGTLSKEVFPTLKPSADISKARPSETHLGRDSAQQLAEPDLDPSVIRYRRLCELNKLIADLPDSVSGDHPSLTEARQLREQLFGSKGELSRRLEQLEKSQPASVQANNKMLVPIDGPSGPKTEALAWNEMVEMLKAPEYKHLQLIKIKPGSTTDGIGWDYIIVNKRNGDFRFIDIKEKPVLGYSEFHMRNAIVAPPHSGAADQKAIIRRDFARILADFKSTGSPFNLIEMKLPLDQASMTPMQDFLTDLKLYPGQRESLFRAWEANVSKRLQALEELTAQCKAAEEHMRDRGRREDARPIRDLIAHTEKLRHFLIDMQRLIEKRDLAACDNRLNGRR